MHSKRAIELSLNFIVIIIISIIIFGFGVNFISRLSKEATELQQMTISELDERIGNLVCEGSERVCIGIDRKTIKRTDFDVFGVKIVNIIDDTNFEVLVWPSSEQPSTTLGYRRDKTTIEYPKNPMLIVNPPLRTVKIDKNSEKTIGIGIQVPSNAESGTYIFNVEIKTAEGFYSKQKIYVDVP